MDPLTKEERESFRQYAGASLEEPDGSECQWANHTLRLLDEADRLREDNARLRQRVEELERERDAAWAVRDAGWVQTEDALTRMRTAEARLARCVEAGNHLRGFAAGTDLGKAYIEDWDAAAKGGE